MVRPPVKELIDEGRIQWLEKEFDPEDAKPYFMIIAATDNPTVNGLVYRTGNELLRLSNSVDDPINCNFIMAALTGHGPMQVAVSSAGCSPALAQKIRRRIANEIVTPQIGRLGAYLGDWRPRIKTELPSYKARQGFWERVLGSNIPNLLEQDRNQADQAMEAGIKWGQRRPSCLTCNVKDHGFVTVCPDCPHRNEDANG